MPTTRRCVFGCKTTGVTIHNFPQPSKYPDRFKIWVNLAGPLLRDLTDEEIFLRKKVCDLHFKSQDKTRNNRLSALAVPSLLLPGVHHKVDSVSHQTTDAPSGSSQIDIPSTPMIIDPGVHHKIDNILHWTIGVPSELSQTDMPSTSIIMKPGTQGSGGIVQDVLQVLHCCIMRNPYVL